MKINREDVQCISFMEKPHPVHELWMKEVSSRKIITYIPRSLMWIRKFSLLSQLVSYVYGFFMPSAKVYLIEAAACVPCVYFKRGKVICINSDTFFYNMRRSKFVETYSKFLLKRIDGYISTSKMMKEKATSVNKKSEVVYPYIEDYNKNLFKIKPKFNNNNICLTAGTRYIKGIDVLLDVFKEHKQKHPDSELFVLGNDEFWQNEIKRSGGAAPGFSLPEPYLKKCGLYINPARHESFGVNILEAMAAGIPPIISNFCGAKELVEKIDKKLIAPINANEILKRIAWLKSNKSRYEKLSRLCKQLALPFTKERSKREFKEKFLILLNGT